MSSIFDLKTSKSELSSTNSGMAELRYREIQPLRNVVDGIPVAATALTKNFSNGEISLRWNLDEQTWFIPRDSYIRMRVKILKNDGGILRPLKVEDQIAPSFGLLPNMLLKSQIKCNNKTIETIDENISQVESLCTRQKMSGSWKRKFGNDINFWNPDFQERVNVISTDGRTHDNTQFVTLIEAANANSGKIANFLDYITPNRIQFVAGAINVGVIRFQKANAAVNGVGFQDLRKIIAPGDRIYYNDGGEKVANVFSITEQVAGSGNFNQIVSTVAVLAVGEADLVNQFRIAKIIPEKKYNERGVSEFEIIWKPLCMGFFNIDHAICGANGRWEWELLPFNNYDVRALESTYGRIVAVNNGEPGSVFFQVTDFRFYLKTCKGPRLEKLSYYLDMNKVKCHTKQLNTATLTQTTIDIMPSTYALAFALQDARVGNNIGYSPSLFIVNNGEEKRIKRYSIRIANLSLPNPDGQYSYSTIVANGIKDNLLEPYVRNKFYDGSYYDANHESLREWRDKLGSYYYHPFLRSGVDKETRAYILTDYSGDGGQQFTSAPRILLFEHYKSLCMIDISDSQITNIISSNS